MSKGCLRKVFPDDVLIPSGPGAVFFKVFIASWRSCLVIRVLFGGRSCGLNRKGWLFMKFSVSWSLVLLNLTFVGIR